MSDLHVFAPSAGQAAARPSPKGANPVDIHVGHRLRRARHAAGLSQTALADVADVSFQQLQKYENGSNRLSASRLVQFAAALGRTPGWFFEGAPGLATGDTPPSADTSDQTAAFLASSAGHELVERASSLDARRLGSLLSVARALQPEH